MREQGPWTLMFNSVNRDCAVNARNADGQVFVVIPGANVKIREVKAVNGREISLKAEKS